MRPCTCAERRHQLGGAAVDEGDESDETPSSEGGGEDAGRSDSMVEEEHDGRDDEVSASGGWSRLQHAKKFFVDSDNSLV